MIILYVIILVIAVKIYDSLPFGVKLVITILSFLIPDPIPVVDELFFLYKLVGNASKVNKAARFLSDNGDSDEK